MMSICWHSDLKWTDIIAEGTIEDADETFIEAMRTTSRDHVVQIEHFDGRLRDDALKQLQLQP